MTGKEKEEKRKGKKKEKHNHQAKEQGIEIASHQISKGQHSIQQQLLQSMISNDVMVAVYSALKSERHMRLA